jgi:hypothetical protein
MPSQVVPVDNGEEGSVDELGLPPVSVGLLDRR